jgi:hypothetical protein
MYAVLVSVTIDDGKEGEAQETLKADVVPMVKASAGFVAGYWFAPEGNKGWSVVLFDSEEAARATAPPAGTRPARCGEERPARYCAAVSKGAATRYVPHPIGLSAATADGC